MGGLTHRHPTEAQIKQDICMWLGLNRIFHWMPVTGGIFDPTAGRFRRLSGSQKKGCPDILAVKRGRLIGIEVKSHTGKTSPYQEDFIRELNKAGALAFVARSVEDVELELLRHFGDLL